MNFDDFNVSFIFQKLLEYLNMLLYFLERKNVGSTLLY